MKKSKLYFPLGALALSLPLAAYAGAASVDPTPDTAIAQLQQSAPYGDKGIGVQIESHQGQDSANYLNVDLHRFLPRSNASQDAQLSRKGAENAARMRAFPARLDATDGNGSPGSALKEYRRRLKLLPTIAGFIQNGKPEDPAYFNIATADQEAQDAAQIVKQIQAGIPQLNAAPTEFVGPIIIAVPGIPTYSVSNPTISTYLSILNARTVYWQQQLASYQQQVTRVVEMLNPDYDGTESNDFGDLQPVSLPKRLAQSNAIIAQSQSDLRALTTRIDSLAQTIMEVEPGRPLPPLSGTRVTQLEAVILHNPVDSAAAGFPAQTRENADVLFNARMALLELETLLPQAEEDAIQLTQANIEAASIQNELTQTLPAVLQALVQAMNAAQAVLNDTAADIAYINAGDFTPQTNQAMIDRKKALLPVVQTAAVGMKDAINQTLIPSLQDSEMDYVPVRAEDGYYPLLNSKIGLYKMVSAAVNKEKTQ